MTFSPQLVALDIDGTIVDREGRLPDSVREAVHRVCQAGVPVVLATGRGVTGAIGVHEELGLPAGLLVVSNGSVLAHSDPLRVVSRHTFDPYHVIDEVLRIHPQARIAVEEVGVGFRVSKHFPDGELAGEIHVEPVEELKATPATRIIVRDPDASPDVFVELADQLGMTGVTYFVGWSAWLDIAPRGVTKASGLQEACDMLGIPASAVLAIGDGNNDIEMLRWAGRGVAVGDALEQVRAAADAVTANFDDDGTAAELNRWFG
mgnify:FL=1